MTHTRDDITFLVDLMVQKGVTKIVIGDIQLERPLGVTSVPIDETPPFAPVSIEDEIKFYLENPV